MFVAGYSLAAALTITSGPSETGNGNFESTTSIPWWTQASVGLSSIPTSVPTALSTTVGSPTVLAATGQAYMINTGVANDVNHFFKFTEAATAVANTELELVFTVSTGAGPTVTIVTVYVETQSTIPGSAQTFTLDYDLGSAGSGSIVLNSVQQVSQTCSAVGTCP